MEHTKCTKIKTIQNFSTIRYSECKLMHLFVCTCGDRRSTFTESDMKINVYIALYYSTYVATKIALLNNCKHCLCFSLINN